MSLSSSACWVEGKFLQANMSNSIFARSAGGGSAKTSCLGSHLIWDVKVLRPLCLCTGKIMINRIMDARFSLKLISVWLLFLGNLILENPLKPQATLTASLPLCVYPLSPFFSFLRVLTFLSLSWAQQSLRNSSEVAWDCKGRSTAAQ